MNYYCEVLHLALVPIPAGLKGPTHSNWQNEPVVDRKQVQQRLCPGQNIGMLHSASGTAVLDLDHPDLAEDALEAVGISLADLLAAPGPKIRSAKGLKPVYRLPPDIKLERKALSWQKEEKRLTIFELRAGNCQDVLPPSIHPETREPYRWEPAQPQTREEIPLLPQQLLFLWQNWAALKPKLESISPWARPPTPKNWTGENISVIDAYNQRFDVRELLERHGYTAQGGNRYLSPSSSTKTAGAVVLMGEDGLERVYSHHASDPLADGHSHDAFSVFTTLEHGGDVKEAVKAAATTLGISQETGHFRTAKPMTRPSVAWPAKLADVGLYGLAGDIVSLVEPHSEADTIALLINFLVGFGNVVGPEAHVKVEGSRHSARLFATLVGDSAKGRKGTSWGQMKNLLVAADDTIAARIINGLSTGEGLIWAVRDAVFKQEPVKEGRRIVEYQEVMVDEGVADKRLLVVEGEFGRILKVIGREGNTLSPCLRDAWDSGDLNVLTKNTPAKATGSHISIIGHVTISELLRYLTQTESANGFANRFLWVCVRRSKELPFGGEFHKEDTAPLLRRLSEAIMFARGVGEITWNTETRPLWEGVYPSLSAGKPGLVGSLTARAEAQVLRLALVYALLDCSSTIKPAHLTAALAVWDYSEASVKYSFQDKLASPLANDIYGVLAQAPGGLTRTEISDTFGRHKSARDLKEALATLEMLEWVEGVKEKTGGRPTERWYVKEGSAK